MFEKEAEEIAKDIYIHHFDDDVNYPCVLQAITIGVQKGAEFGYNKANEWHYPKDGDLPTHTRPVLVYLSSDDVDIDHYVKNLWWKNHLTEQIIAWKEIVLPELKEIE